MFLRPAYPDGPCDNLSAGPNLSKGLTRKTGHSKNSPKPWIRMGRAAHPTHKTRRGPVIQVTASSFPARSERRKLFCISLWGGGGGRGFAGGQKEDLLFRWQSKGAEGARPPAGIGPVLVTPPAI